MIRKMRTINCAYCKKEFKSNGSRAKYCSEDCRIKRQPTKECEICGTLFNVPFAEIKRGRKYCSEKCYIQSKYKQVDVTCLNCGKEFEIPQCRLGRKKYCSNKCKYEAKHNHVERECLTCGKKIKVIGSYILKGEGKYCTKKCYGISQRGKGNPAWKGGITFGKYCSKFNDEFKERVRNFFGRKCMLCGKVEDDRKLCVHHVTYDKKACCNDKIAMFIPLCTICHSKTNWKRKAWENTFFTYINLYFDGKSYLGQEEVTYYTVED